MRTLTSSPTERPMADHIVVGPMDLIPAVWRERRWTVDRTQYRNITVGSTLRFEEKVGGTILGRMRVAKIELALDPAKMVLVLEDAPADEPTTSATDEPQASAS
jgi:hypothetical protein